MFWSARDGDCAKNIGAGNAVDSNMAGDKNKKLTKEEELLLQDFSRNVTTKSSALFYGNAFIVSAVPICEFYLDLVQIKVEICFPALHI